MAASPPVRLDSDLAESARAAAQSMSRSLAQQLSHWARIGRELERSPGVTLDAVRAVLTGAGEYDALNVQEQAIVRVAWNERIESRRENLRLDLAFAEEGHSYAEIDAQGQVTVTAAGESNPRSHSKATRRPRPKAVR